MQLEESRSLNKRWIWNYRRLRGSGAASRWFQMCEIAVVYLDSSIDSLSHHGYI